MSRPCSCTTVGPGTDENEVINVLMRWNHFRGVYAFDCHNTEHEDCDMMTQCQTV